MAIKHKSGGAYTDVVGVFHKRAGTYEAVQGIYAKAGGVYGRVDAATVTLSVTPSRTSGFAPLAVFFDATATTSTLTAEPWRDVLYAFDYGDLGAGTYTYGAQTGASKNRNVGGPCGGHVYETPGTYTASVWGYDGASLVLSQHTITVTDPDVVFAGTNTICVSNSGNFAGAPAGASQQAAATWQAAVALCAGGKRVLLQRADTWTQTAAANLPANAINCIIGSFGTGTKATITKSTLASTVRLWVDSVNIVFRDLHFNGGSLNAKIFEGVTGQAPNRITIHNVSTDLCGSTFVSEGTNRTDDLTFHKVEITNVSGGAGNVGIFPTCTNLLLLDSKVDTATSAEHCIRSSYVGKGFIYGITAVNPANNKQAITIRAPLWAGGAVIGLPANTYTEYAVVGNSKFSGNTALICAFGPSNSTVDEKIRRCIFEGNYVFATGSNVQDGHIVYAFEHTSRNNVYNMSGGSAFNNGVSVQVTTAVPAYNGTRIYNETIYRDSGGTTIAAVAVGNINVTDIHVKNVIQYTPTVANATVISGAGAGNVTAGGNSTNVQAKTTDPLFNGALTAIEGFRLQSGSPYKNAGVAVPLFVDGLAYRRTGTQDGGALNAVDKNTSIWGSVLPA